MIGISRYMALVVATLAVVTPVAGCGSGDDDGGQSPKAETHSRAKDEQQIRAVVQAAAVAVVARDAQKLCIVTDTSNLESEIRQSGRRNLVRLLDRKGPQAVCVRLAQALLRDLSPEETSDATSVKIVRITLDGDDATAKLRTDDDTSDATLRRVDGVWKFVGSPVLE